MRLTLQLSSQRQRVEGKTQIVYFKLMCSKEEGECIGERQSGNKVTVVASEQHQHEFRSVAIAERAQVMSAREKWPPICAHPHTAPEPSHSVSSPASGDDGGEEDRSSISSFPRGSCSSCPFVLPQAPQRPLM